MPDQELDRLAAGVAVMREGARVALVQQRLRCTERRAEHEHAQVLAGAGVAGHVQVPRKSDTIQTRRDAAPVAARHRVGRVAASAARTFRRDDRAVWRAALLWCQRQRRHAPVPE